MEEVFGLSNEDLQSERAALLTQVTTIKQSLLKGGRREVLQDQLDAALLRLQEVSEEQAFRATAVVVGDYVEVEVVVRSAMFRVRRTVKAKVISVTNGVARVVGYLMDGTQVRVDLDQGCKFTKIPDQM